MASLSPKHIEFINLVASGTSQTDAYKVTCGNKAVTSNVAKVKGSQLAKKYAVLINEERERLRKVVEAANDSKVSEIAKMNIMGKAERMELLTKMAKGELKIKTPFVIAGKIMEYPAEPTASDRRAAIAELNKMGGDYAPAQLNTTITDTRPPSKITTPDGLIIEL
jgi:hypothetical protein